MYQANMMMNINVRINKKMILSVRNKARMILQCTKQNGKEDKKTEITLSTKQNDEDPNYFEDTK